MIALRIQPLRIEGRVLLPVGQSLTIQSDYLNTRRAIVEECRERGWFVHRRSRQLCACVAEGVVPAEVVYTADGGLIGVWKGGIL
jgi:hypothetical protein